LPAGAGAGRRSAFAAGSGFVLSSLPAVFLAAALAAGVLMPGNTRADVRINGANCCAGRPTLAAGPNNTLYAAVEDLCLQWIYVYGSTDQGATWTYLTGVVGGYPGTNLSYPSIACGRDEGGTTWIFVAYETLVADGSRSVDILRFDPANPGGADIFTVDTIYIDDEVHPEICSDWPIYSNFSLYLTYDAQGGVDPASQVKFARSDDHAQTWILRQTLATASLATNQRPHICFGGPLGFPGESFRVYTVYEMAVPGGTLWENDIWVRVSRDFGNTWDAPVQLTTSGDDDYDARVAVATYNSSAVVVYTSNWQNSGDLDIRTAYTTDSGVNWTTANLLAGSSLVEKAPEITVTFDHRFHCAYWKNWDILYTWTPSATPNQWSAPEVINDTHQADLIHSRPTLRALSNVPEANEGTIAWTDLRNGQFDTYFDLVPSASAVAPPESPATTGGLTLGTPRPNPAGSHGRLLFPVRSDGPARVQVEVFDAAGRRVASTAPHDCITAGEHIIEWTVPGLAPGIYFARLMAENGRTRSTVRLVID
jgi:hypothetical protein